MKNKLADLMIVFSMTFGMPNYGNDEHKEEANISEEEQLKIPREIIRIYSNLKYFKYWDPLAEEIGQAASRAGWNDAMLAAWGGTVAAASHVTVYRPQDAYRLAQFSALRKRQNYIEQAIKKTPLRSLSPKDLKQALSEFLDISCRRLQNEQLDQRYKVIKGRCEYLLEEIAGVVLQYQENALPDDEAYIVEKFEALFAAIAPEVLQADCSNLQKTSRCTYEQELP